MTTTTATTVAGPVSRTDDQRGRDLARTCFDRPLVVEAGAGTGKTATLVARVLTWVLGPGWDRERSRRASAGRPRADQDVAGGVLGRVVAITFTEAAAAEMADRVGEGLRGVAAGKPPVGLPADDLSPDAGVRARALLASLDSLEVRTIHSFCARLLQEHALSAGVHPAFSVDADGDALQELIEDVVRDALIAGYGPEPDADLLALGEAGVGPQDMVDALSALSRACVTSADLDGDPLQDPAVDAMLARLVDDLATVRDELAALVGVKGRTNLRDLHATLDEAVDGSALSLDAAIVLAEDLLDAHDSALKKLEGGKLSKTEDKLLGRPPALLAAGARLRPVLRYLHDLDPEGLRRSVRVLVPLLRDVETRRKRRGLLTFSDLLARAAALLDDQPAVRVRLREGMDQLLVDEFQDTDPLQCRIVAHLALSGDRDARPGLFIVGDPKQSIYGWRRADLAAYEAFVQDVVAAGGERVSLVVNFRSVPPVLDAVQGALQPVMRHRPGLQPDFQALLPCPRLADASGFVAAAHHPVEVWSCWQWDEGAPLQRQRKGPVRAIEAHAVARDIATVHEQGVAWADIAVLFRASTDLPLLVDALRAAGVPYAVTRDRTYFQRREITDAINLVSVVAAPHDQVALVGWLRSAMVGVPDAALLPLWRRGLPRELALLSGPEDARLATIQDLFRAAAADAAAIHPPIVGLDRVTGWEHSAMRAVLGLARMRRSLREDACDRFVQCLRDESLIELSEAARYMGVFRLANLDRFFRGLRDGLAEGGDLQAVLRTLREGLAGAREGEEGRPQEAAEDAVQLMTIHKSKGLGFGHVYVVGLDKQGRPPATASNEVHDTGAWRLLGHESPGLRGRIEHAERVGDAERLRLLYVAMTRAKQRLVLSGLWPQTLDRQPDVDAARSMIDLLGAWAAVPADLADTAVGLDPHLDRLQQPGALLVFPGRIDSGSLQPVAPAGAAVPLATVARARADAERIAAAKQAARQRQQRPWTAAVSAEAHARLADEALDPDLPPGLGQRGAASGMPEAGGTGVAAMPVVAGTGAVAGGLPPDLAQEAAMAAGSAVHRALELIELGGADPDDALDQQIAALPRYVAALVDEPVATAAQDRAATILVALRGGAILDRLHAHAGHIVARELPVLLPPPSDPQVSRGHVPVAGYVGAVDLLLWDPTAEQLVVVDYKTDDVSGEALLQRAAAYRSQARAYADAVQQALQPQRPPRAELWFLRRDRIVQV